MPGAAEVARRYATAVAEEKGAPSRGGKRRRRG